MCTDNGISNFHSEIDRNNEFVNTKNFNDTIRNIHIKYHKNLIKILSEINPDVLLIRLFYNFNC